MNPTPIEAGRRPARRPPEPLPDCGSARDPEPDPFLKDPERPVGEIHRNQGRKRPVHH
ncbi:hypothetical protein [Pseudomonas solani]|uniref:hypothetical protein n=1 Tax=Pseudomonas solani TaxID=2731552 RepID=UPI003D6B7E4A